MREQRRLRVFKNWVIRRIFGSTRDKVIAEWKTLHNKKTLCSGILTMC
jgi:hypothetical protein